MNQALTWSASNVRKAKQRLGVTAYRPGQEAIVDAVMQGKDVLGILPTGGGKSLCYQLPSLFMPHAVVVVSPLISLMKDQQDKLEDRAIPVAKLDSTLSAQAERDAVDTIREGEPELIYVTPERLEQDECLTMLRRTGVSLMVVDEAHCISQWGHDFRPAYLSIREAVRALGRPPVLALTATATPDVAADILKQLDIPNAIVVNLGSYRPNLIYEVRRTVNEAEKLQHLTGLLRGLKDGPALVYVATIRQAVDLFGVLREAGFEAGCYHGKLPAKERHRTQQDFMEDRLGVVVATKAFGLGIDKPNLRMVVHYTLPDSIESYVQETGRAGRDGKPAWGVLLYRLEDRRVQAYFLGGKYPRREESAQVYREIVRATDDKHGGNLTLKRLSAATGIAEARVKVVTALLQAMGIIERGRRITLTRRFGDQDEFMAYLSEYERRHQSDRDRLDMMMKYGQTTGCRARFLTRYFGAELSQDCGQCDNCRSGAAHRVVDVRHLGAEAALTG
jgi:ATP-dependent DNA helicase RecQ